MEQQSNRNKGRVEVYWNPMLQINKINEQKKEVKNVRVAAYCRVSTLQDSQENSIELQESYYTRYINNTHGWQLAGIYIDHGISGTGSNQRLGFQRMIRHCKEGKIDKIVCKSISRFARNTKDFLETMRILKELKVGVVFEKEGIDTQTVQNEFLLSTIAAIAQDESRSISENMEWSFKKRFKSGIPYFKRILGYNKIGGGAAKQIVIIEEEALIIREIFALAIKGKGFTEIARIMMSKGYKTVTGKIDWSVDYVKAILTNERYTGDVLCQKTYTRDFITHDSKPNVGHKNQYLIENNHEGIISHKDFYEVQSAVCHRKTGKPKLKKTYSLSSRIVCSKCGGNYNHYYSYNNPGWRCVRCIKNKNVSDTNHIKEEVLERVMLKALHIRYDINSKCCIDRLIHDIETLQEYNIEEVRVNNKIELAELLYKEIHASYEEQSTAKENRISFETKLKEQEEFWKLLEKDRIFRTKALRWLNSLPYGKSRSKIFLNKVNIEYMRALVIGITVISPVSFIINWFDNKETAVELVEEYE